MLGAVDLTEQQQCFAMEGSQIMPKSSSKTEEA